jgi:hypothetical protein
MMIGPLTGRSHRIPPACGRKIIGRPAESEVTHRFYKVADDNTAGSRSALLPRCASKRMHILGFMSYSWHDQNG